MSDIMKTYNCIILFLFISILAVAQSPVSSQPDSINQAKTIESSRRETRASLMGGFNGYIEEKYKFYFLNLHSRTFKKATSDLQLNYATEWGLNLPYILPYFKVGPEVRILKNIYLDAHTGIGILIIPALSNPFGFWGVEIGYSLKISIDFETGVNYLLDNNEDNLHIPYVSIGLSVLN